ncbi:Carbohydrate kinase family [Verrucomicrobiia bacterium DG1235]|nr:Carbohydrate kinase family [Verrucomicrobiae bacterium DG1235]
MVLAVMRSEDYPASHPILSCSQSVEWESKLLGSENDSWMAMQAAGKRVGNEIRRAYAMTCFPQKELSVLGLIGKGHNGGDALLAIGELVRREGYIKQVGLILPAPLDDLRPNTRRAFKLLESQLELSVGIWPSLDATTLVEKGGFDICIDGLLGMQFRPPLRDVARGIIDAVNACSSIRLRVAVDLPSGVGDESDAEPFWADFTFATGIFKRPLLGAASAGLARYLDIGFFDDDLVVPERVLIDEILNPLRAIRPADSEKRDFGHLAILAGSRGMPGALAMCVRSALQSGVGLVTVYAPESVASQLACNLSEAMWRSWPETPEGGLALEGLWQIKPMLAKASCLLLGPGMGTEKETHALLCEIGKQWDKPAVLDADALRPEIVAAFSDAGNRDLALTPHDGEFKRLTGCSDCSDTAVLEYAKANELCLVKKGSATRVTDGETVFVNATGNAVLSRGGSGDLLAGLIAGLLAQGGEPLLAACRAVYWHGKAADLLAMAKGQTAARTTDLLDYLAPALRT